MDPHSSDFIESAPEPRRQHSGFRRLALLLPLVAAVPISIAVLSQRNNASAERSESIPPPGLTPTSGLASTDPAPAAAPATAPVPEPVATASENSAPSPASGSTSETVEPGELSKILAEAVREQAASSNSGKAESDSKPGPPATEEDPVATAAPPVEKNGPGHDGTNQEAAAKAVEEEKAKPIVVAPIKSTAAMPNQHIVESGDTLYSLSKRYGVPAERLSAANGIGPTGAIQKGQTLKIPVAAESGQLHTNSKPTGPSRPASQPLRPVSGFPEQTSPRKAEAPVQKPIKLMPIASADTRSEQKQAQSSSATANTNYPHANGEFVPSEPKSNSRQSVGTAPVALRPVGGNLHSQANSPKTDSKALEQCIGYIVQPNDTLPSIAAGHSTTVGAVAGLNGGILRVSPGQMIVIPIHNIATHCAR